MAAYRILRRWVALFLGGYFVLGLATLLLPQQEAFPCYSWFLFALVPGQESQYALRLQEVRGQKLAAPRLYQDAEDIVDDAHSVTMRQLVQRLGAAVEKGNVDEQRRIRRVIEKDHLPMPCRYELVIITYEPLTRWRTGQSEVKSLAQFESTGATP